LCEQLTVRWPTPQPFGRVTDWVLQIERFGSCRLGWGVAWRDRGEVRSYRSIGSFTGDLDGRASLALVESAEFLVHLRRPTLLSTMQLADAQPFVDAAASFAFCHNGNFANESEYRDRYRNELQGSADSEVGYCMLRELLVTGVGPAEALATVHAKLAGNANLGYLGADGTALVLSSHPINQMWEFRLGEALITATQLHSRDNSLFDLVFTGATDRHPISGVHVMAPA
jgi:predicted glutamine amidotransferase